jgi:hypothetical protein
MNRTSSGFATGEAAMAYAVEQVHTIKGTGSESTGRDDQQLALSETWMRARAAAMRRASMEPPLCAGCRAREARYGFRQDDQDPLERPRTLCFECFRMELARRQAAAAQLARGWNAEQEPLPLEDTLSALDRRRRRAQIAARRALGSS